MDPILNTPQQTSIDNVLLYRDRARTKIGQWNLNNLDVSSIQALINSIAARGEKASSSCGAMSFYLEKILQKNHYNAHMLSFYSIRNDILRLHAANFVDINGIGSIIDGFSGVVWQNEQGKIASPLAFGCQTICHDADYSNWEYYPSTHGRQHSPHNGMFYYGLDYTYMAPQSYKPERDPGLISAIAIIKPNKDHLKTYFQTLYIFDNGRLSQKYLTQLYELWHRIGNLQADTVIRYIDKNDCDCNGATVTEQNLNNFNFQTYVPKEKKSKNYFNEPQGPAELLKVN